MGFLGGTVMSAPTLKSGWCLLCKIFGTNFMMFLYCCFWHAYWGRYKFYLIILHCFIDTLCERSIFLS